MRFFLNNIQTAINKLDMLLHHMESEKKTLALSQRFGSII